jgi:uncharacterized membrane protein YgcG
MREWAGAFAAARRPGAAPGDALRPLPLRPPPRPHLTHPTPHPHRSGASSWTPPAAAPALSCRAWTTSCPGPAPAAAAAAAATMLTRPRRSGWSSSPSFRWTALALGNARPWGNEKVPRAAAAWPWGTFSGWLRSSFPASHLRWPLAACVHASPPALTNPALLPPPPLVRRPQEAALCHALGFPALERLAYSTCSVHRRENEDVVAAVLPAARAAGFDLVDPFPGGGWARRGEAGSLPGGRAARVVRTDAREDGTDGFFVAVFERRRGGGGHSSGEGDEGGQGGGSEDGGGGSGGGGAGGFAPAAPERRPGGSGGSSGGSGGKKKRRKKGAP